MKKHRIIFIALSLFFVLASTTGLWAQPLAPSADWKQWDSLLGEWVGEGGGGPGQATGGFSFSLDLQNRILVRKNFADYPATKDRPAFRHDDLMIVYQESGNPTRAEYFDNEGHVIRYTVQFSEDGKSVIFVSEASAQGPRYRLTNTKEGDDRISITFEMAPPGKPDAFQQYIKAFANKKKG